MKIVVIGSFADSLVKFRGPLLKRMADAGHEVHALAPNLSTGIVDQIEAWGVSIHEIELQRTGMNPFGDLAYLRRLRVLICRLAPDLVLTYTVKPNIWGAFAAHSCGVRSVAMVTGLGFVFTPGSKVSLVKMAIKAAVSYLYRRATNLNEMVVFQNPDDIKDFVAAGCLAEPVKAFIINGSGVDMEHYSIAPLPEAPVFVMISRLLKNKGVREYAEAAIRVKRAYPHARFLLVGYFDEGTDSIDHSVLESWIQQGLEYLGPRDDVRPTLASARIFVLPSYREGTPRSVLEAMAMGRAIITTDVPGCRETVANGLNGFLVPPRDALTLAEKMEEMIEKPKLCERMAAASYRIACEKYDSTKVNDVLLELLGVEA